MISAFGVEHTISKSMSPGKLAGLRAAAKGPYGEAGPRYAHKRVKMWEFGQEKARLGGQQRPKNFYHTGPHMKRSNRKDLRIARGEGYKIKPNTKIGMQGSLPERMKAGVLAQRKKTP